MGGARHATSTQDVPIWMQPYTKELAAAGVDLGLPGGQVGTMPANLNQQVAPLNPTQQAGLGDIVSTAQGQQGVSGAAIPEVTDTLSGKFLDPATNPYLTSTYDAASRAMTDQYRNATAPGLMADAERAGAFGGSAYGQAADAARFGLGENLANLATDIYGGNYQAERARQAAAPGQLGTALQTAYVPGQEQIGAGTVQQQQQQTEYDTALQNAIRQQQFPWQQLQNVGDILGSARGPGGVSVSPTRAGWLKTFLPFLFLTSYLVQSWLS